MFPLNSHCISTVFSFLHLRYCCYYYDNIIMIIDQFLSCSLLLGTVENHTNTEAVFSMFFCQLPLLCHVIFTIAIFWPCFAPFCLFRSFCTCLNRKTSLILLLTALGHFRFSVYIKVNWLDFVNILIIFIVCHLIHPL